MSESVVDFGRKGFTVSRGPQWLAPVGLVVGTSLAIFVLSAHLFSLVLGSFTAGMLGAVVLTTVFCVANMGIIRHALSPVTAGRARHWVIAAPWAVTVAASASILVRVALRLTVPVVVVAAVVAGAIATVVYFRRTVHKINALQLRMRSLKIRTVEHARTLIDECDRALCDPAVRPDQRVVAELNRARAQLVLSLDRRHRHLLKDALATLRRMLQDETIDPVLAVVAAIDMESAMSLDAEQRWGGSVPAYVSIADQPDEDPPFYAEAQRLLAFWLDRVPQFEIGGALHSSRAAFYAHAGRQASGEGRAPDAATNCELALAELDAAVRASAADPDSAALYRSQLAAMLLMSERLTGRDRLDEALEQFDRAERLARSRATRVDIRLLHAVCRVGFAGDFRTSKRTESLARARGILRPIARWRGPYRSRARALLAEIELLELPSGAALGPVARQIRAVVESLAEDSTFDTVGLVDAWLTAAQDQGTEDEIADALFYRVVTLTQRARDPLTLAKRDRLLISSDTVPTEAGYWLARVGRVSDAVVAVESSRAILFERLTGWLDPAVKDALVAGGHTGLLHSYLTALEELGVHYRRQYTPHSRRAPEVISGDVAFSTGYTSELWSAQATVDKLANTIQATTGMKREPLRTVSSAAIQRSATHFPLVYLGAAPDGGYALLVTPTEEPHVVWLPQFTEAAVFEHVEAIEAAEKRPDRDDAVAAAVTWLIDQALPPLALELGRRTASATDPTIGLIPVHLVGLLPISGALLAATSTTGRPPLAVHNLPCARAVGVPNRATSREVRVFTAPEGSAARPCPQIRHVDRELSWLRTRYGDRLRTWQDARTSDVVHRADGADILEFICHGVAADADRPLDSALLLTDRPLTVGRLLSCTRFGYRLVILTACESQVFTSAMADETVGLPLAFLQAGAGAVIASGWPVDGAPTHLLMRRLHDELADGVAPARALANAQDWLRTVDLAEIQARYPDMVSPLNRNQLANTEAVHWAAFSCTGHL